ncbi:MAG: TetR/AcrR family transcriptional regulator, partial [Aureispira sp.]
AALTLLTRNGIHATPMSAIAKEAGTGMGTIYNYFPNKEMLINAIYVQIKKEEEGLFTVYGEGKDLREHFEEYYKNIVQFFLMHPAYFHFMEQLQASPIITAESKAAGYKAITPVLILIERGQQEGRIKTMPTAELMPFIGGTILAYLRLHFQEGREKPSLINQLQLVWDAIRA